MQNFQKQFILALIAYAAKRDVEPSLACLHAGLDVKALESDSNVVISDYHVESLWKNLVSLSRDPQFGLHFGESMQLAALGVIGQIIQTSRNVGEALTTAGMLVRMLTDMFTMHIEHCGTTFMIRLLADQKKKEMFPYTYRHLADYLMVFIVHELDGLMFRKMTPIAATFPYVSAQDYEYNRVMRCQVKTNPAEFSIELNSNILDQSIISANYEIQNRLLEIVNSTPNSQAKFDTWSLKVYNHLLTNSYMFGLSLESTAANFNISTRTLQRKLTDEGQSFQRIADDVKRDLAFSYLGSGRYQIKDIAFMLGYKEESAMIRAFKRWTGKTPGSFKIDTGLPHAAKAAD